MEHLVLGSEHSFNPIGSPQDGEIEIERGWGDKLNFIQETEKERITLFKRQDNTLLHKDKDLSTSWPFFLFFYKSVPDDKNCNTQYVKQEYK